MKRRQSYFVWLSVVSKQLDILYGVEADIFSDVYNFRQAYEDKKSTRLVVEELALILE